MVSLHEFEMETVRSVLQQEMWKNIQQSVGMRLYQMILSIKTEEK